MIEERCLCGHLYSEHEPTDAPLRNPPGDSFCNECCLKRHDGNWHNNWHDYKIDNLALVEKLAKERKLI